MRHWWFCVAAPIAILLSACGSPGGSPVSSQQPVTLTIGIDYVGGAAPGHSEHLAPGTIRLRGPGTDASQRVSDGQTATFSVRPGEYTASARSGDAQCAETEVKAAAREVRTASPWRVRCDVK